MEFSSLVLMERDKETKHLIREIGSFQVGDGAQYVTKFYYDGDIVNMYFDTMKDVEEWEYSAIFDLFNTEVFVENGFEIDEDLEEYNPAWVVKFQYIEEHKEMEEKISTACSLIEEEMEKVFENIKGKEEEYK
jgi:hypothetical protein